MGGGTLNGSRPSRARGLKQADRITVSEPLESRPSRARGLKLWQSRYHLPHGIVAPFAGAWIETGAEPAILRAVPTSRPSRARGLKLTYRPERSEERRVG